MPSTYRLIVQQFKQMLEQFKQEIVKSNPFSDRLSNDLQQIAEIFQQQVEQLSTAPLPPVTASRTRLIQTEINKQLRLLKTDLAFYQTAKQAAKIVQRQQQMSDRCDLLLTYCTALLDLPTQ